MVLSERTVIAGAGQSGLQVAISLRQGGYTGEIILVGKEPHVPYQRPPLSKQVLKNEWAAERCHLRHLEFYSEHNIDLLTGVAATGLDPVSRRLGLSDGTYWGFTHLAICTGSQLNRLSVPGSELPGIHYLRNIDEALILSAALETSRHLAVIGGGYIGLEVAAAARARGCAVTVVEALDQLMKRSALAPVADWLHRRHESEGVQFRMSRKVVAIRGRDRVEGVELDSGEVVPADLVMVGVGVRPDLAWLEGSGILTGRGVRVDNACRTSAEGIYAAGDVAEFEHPLLDGWHVLESVQNAVSQGKLIAANILGKNEVYAEVPWFWSEQYDCKLQMAGIPRAGDQWVHRDNPDTGGFTLFTLTDGRLTAVQCLNSPRDYMVGRQLITHGASPDPVALADPQVSLKDLS